MLETILQQKRNSLEDRKHQKVRFSSMSKSIYRQNNIGKVMEHPAQSMRYDVIDTVLH